MPIAEYLLRRLHALGVEHVFGIPGDFILPFFQAMAASDVTHVAACNELNAGYAADGYARLRGLGAVAVTYGPGSFSVVNAVAGAFAESIPLVVISGGPDSRHYRERTPLHHVLPDRYESSVAIFEQVTVFSAALTVAEEAAATIDRALALCLARRKPIFLELPADVQTHRVAPPRPLPAREPAGDARATAAVVARLRERLHRSEQAVLLPGHEIQSWGLSEKLVALVQASGIPAASLLIGKATYLEGSPHCLGAYMGAGCPAPVRRYVESADTVVFLGAVPCDFNLGAFTAELHEEQCVTLWENKAWFGAELVEGVPLSAVVEALLADPPRPARPARPPVQAFLHRRGQTHRADAQAAITNGRFYERIAHFLRPGDVVAADAGCAVNALHIEMPADSVFLASLYWASIGAGFAASLGAAFAAGDKRRVVALEGDGSFQMTAQELSSLIRYDKRVIVFVVNNRGYTAERLIHEGAFNDIADWRYHALPAAFGGRPGMLVRTEGELEEALAAAEAHRGPGPLLIEVSMDPMDASEAFRLMSEGLRH